MAPRFAFPAADVDAAGLPVELDLTAGWLALELSDTEIRPAAAPESEPVGHLSGRLSRSGSADIVVRGRLVASLSAPCARCLDPAAVSVSTELSLLLRPARWGSTSGAGAGSSADRRAPRDAVASRGGAARGGASRGGASRGAPASGGSAPAAADGKAAAAVPAKAPRKPRRRDDEEEELRDEDASTDVYDGETVVLDPFLREAILLEIPIFPLCSDTCAGIRLDPSAGVRGADASGAARSSSLSAQPSKRAAGTRGASGVTDDPAEHDSLEDPPVPDRAGDGELDPRLAPLAAIRDRLAGKGDPDDLAKRAAGSRDARLAKLRLPTSGLRRKTKR